MNAYKLAQQLNQMDRGLLEDLSDSEFSIIENCEAMIRQQADRIAELEKRPAVNKEDGLVCAKCFKGIGE
jgi:hypothetical protein